MSDAIADVVYRFLCKHYGTDRATWEDPEFHCYCDLPVELRSVPICGWIEYNITNGGVEQLLLNSGTHWREVLDCGIRTYEAMGELQGTAELSRFRDAALNCGDEIDGFVRRCDEEDDDLCMEVHEYFDKQPELADPESIMSCKVSERRYEWLERNRDKLLMLIRALSSKRK